jgi:hypothetical protein
MRFGAVLGVLALVVASQSTVPGVALAIEGVSPGAADRLVSIDTSCPTFNWQEVEGAGYYELVAYALPEQLEAAAAVRAGFEDFAETLYVRVLGGATGWTPSSSDCLPAGGSFVWFVRAVGGARDEALAASGDWSPARFFKVQEGPSPREIERALDVLRAYVASEGGEAPESEPGPIVVATDEPAAEAEPSQRSRESDEEPRAATTADAALRASLPDTDNESYGVVGLSNSPAGAGVAAVNTDGGVDLVLDGSADGNVSTELTESGIVRVSTADQTFSVANPSTGDIRFVLPDDARLGVGTSNPGFNLHVVRDATSNINPTALLKATGAGSVSSLRFENADGDHFNLGITDDGAFAIGAPSQNISLDDPFRVGEFGDVLIGPGATQHPFMVASVNGGMRAAEVRAYDGAGLKLADDTGELGIFVSVPFGEVGIQTFAPDEALTVSGKIKVSQELLFASPGFAAEAWIDRFGSSPSTGLKAEAAGDILLEPGATRSVAVGDWFALDPDDMLDVQGDIDATGCIQTDNTGSIGGTCLSDARLKRDVQALRGSLELIGRLRPVSFVWREDAWPISREEGSAIGLIAQELEAVFPHLVRTDVHGYKRVRYDIELQMHLIQAIKELKAEIEVLEGRLAEE